MGHPLISKIYGYCTYALAVFTKKIKPNPNTFVFGLGFDWREEWDSLRDIQIITCFKFHSILTLIFCHNVAITRKKIHLHSKDEIGIQPFPASGSPSAGFSLSLKCERRQQVAAYSPFEFPPIKKDTQGVFFYWRKRGDSNP